MMRVARVIGIVLAALVLVISVALLASGRY